MSAEAEVAPVEREVANAEPAKEKDMRGLQAAPKKKESEIVSKWSTSQVDRWVASQLGESGYWVGRFVAKSVDGKQLLRLTSCKLEDIGIAKLHTPKLLTAIAKLKRRNDNLEKTSAAAASDARVKKEKDRRAQETADRKALQEQKALELAKANKESKICTLEAKKKALAREEAETAATLAEMKKERDRLLNAKAKILDARAMEAAETAKAAREKKAVDKAEEDKKALELAKKLAKVRQERSVAHRGYQETSRKKYAESGENFAKKWKGEINKIREKQELDDEKRAEEHKKNLGLIKRDKEERKAMLEKDAEDTREDNKVFKAQMAQMKSLNAERQAKMDEGISKMRTRIKNKRGERQAQRCQAAEEAANANKAEKAKFKQAFKAKEEAEQARLENAALIKAPKWSASAKRKLSSWSTPEIEKWALIYMPRALANSIIEKVADGNGLTSLSQPSLSGMGFKVMLERNQILSSLHRLNKKYTKVRNEVTPILELAVRKRGGAPSQVKYDGLTVTQAKEGIEDSKFALYREMFELFDDPTTGDYDDQQGQKWADSRKKNPAVAEAAAPPAEPAAEPAAEEAPKEEAPKEEAPAEQKEEQKAQDGAIADGAAAEPAAEPAQEASTEAEPAAESTPPEEVYPEGKISKNTLVRIFTALGSFPFTQRDVDELFAYWDGDADGRINFAEYLMAVKERVTAHLKSQKLVVKVPKKRKRRVAPSPPIRYSRKLRTAVGSWKTEAVQGWIRTKLSKAAADVVLRHVNDGWDLLLLDDENLKRIGFNTSTGRRNVLRALRRLNDRFNSQERTKQRLGKYSSPKKSRARVVSG